MRKVLQKYLLLNNCLSSEFQKAHRDGYNFLTNLKEKEVRNRGRKKKSRHCFIKYFSQKLFQ